MNTNRHEYGGTSFRQGRRAQSSRRGPHRLLSCRDFLHRCTGCTGFFQETAGLQSWASASPQRIITRAGFRRHNLSPCLSCASCASMFIKRNRFSGIVAVRSKRRRGPGLHQAWCGRDARAPGWVPVDRLHCLHFTRLSRNQDSPSRRILQKAHHSVHWCSFVSIGGSSFSFVDIFCMPS